jgi:transcriptional regulator with XRE-family HTH domain
MSFAMAAKKNFVILGSFLKKKRLENGYSQGDMAKLLGYTNPQPISNCERGLSSLPVSKLRKVISLFKITPEEMTDVLLDQQKVFYLQTFKQKKSK